LMMSQDSRINKLEKLVQNVNKKFTQEISFKEEFTKKLDQADKNATNAIKLYNKRDKLKNENLDKNYKKLEQKLVHLEQNFDKKLFEKENLIKIDVSKSFGEKIGKVDEIISNIDKRVNDNAENVKLNCKKFETDIDGVKNLLTTKINIEINQNQLKFNLINNLETDFKLLNNKFTELLKSNDNQIKNLNKNLNNLKTEIIHVKTEWLGPKDFHIQMPYLNYHDKNSHDGYDPNHDEMTVHGYHLATSLYANVIPSLIRSITTQFDVLFCTKFMKLLKNVLEIYKRDQSIIERSEFSLTNFQKSKQEMIDQKIKE